MSDIERLNEFSNFSEHVYKQSVLSLLPDIPNWRLMSDSLVNHALGLLLYWGVNVKFRITIYCYLTEQTSAVKRSKKDEHLSLISTPNLG